MGGGSSELQEFKRLVNDELAALSAEIRQLKERVAALEKAARGKEAWR